MSEVVSIPMVSPLTTRDSTTSKDSKMLNCSPEKEGAEWQLLKRPGLNLTNPLTTGKGQGIYCYNDITKAIIDDTLVSNFSLAPVADGNTWTTTLASSFPWDTGGQVRIVTFNNELYAVGGWPAAGTSGCWKSTDGITWTQLTITAPWATRVAHGVVVFDNRIWVFGGYNNSLATYYNDVWYSYDGITWTQATASASWATRYLFGYTIYDNRMWVFGGMDGGTLTPTNDVWYSYDGITWTSATGAASWASRHSLTAVVYNNLLWIIGGIGASNYDDAWKSSDGATWTNTTVTLTGTAISQTASYTYDNKLWAVGGYDASIPAVRATVYHTIDGITWTLVTSSATFGDIRTGSMTLYQNTMWVGGQPVSYAPLSDYGGTTYSITTSTPRVQFDFSNSGAASAARYVVMKNSTDGFYFDTTTSTLTKITDINYPATTVPGIVYLDGYFFVMTPSAQIQNSNIEDPSIWGALNYINAEIEPDTGVAIAKHLNYLVAFGTWTTQFFYDAANPTGSPLATVPNAFFELGCSSGNSVVEMNNSVFWMTQSKQKGRQIAYLEGFVPRIISSPQIEKILNDDDLSTVYSYGARLSGHELYILTLVSSNKTIVFDLVTQQWSFWSSLNPKSDKSVTSLTLGADGKTVTAIITNHGASDGDPVAISGAIETEYNGRFNITYIDANTFTYEVKTTPSSSPATGTILATFYDETYFKGIRYTYCGGKDLIQHETNGNVFEISPDYFDDDVYPINMISRGVKFDANSTRRKRISSAEVVGDKVSATGLLRHTDDDYQTYSKYRRVDLSAKRSLLVRMGQTRRRAHEFRCTDAQPIRLERLEFEVTGGTS